MENQKHKYSLVLASGSPRRKELLGWLNLPYEVIVSNVDEDSPTKEPALLVSELARKKGKHIFDELEKKKGFTLDYFPLVVGADTIVTLDQEILGKPKDDDDAKTMLMKLSGRTHEVLTGVYLGILDKNLKSYREELFVCRTEVEFATISQDLLHDYVVSGDPLDKAGAYGIQGQALSFIRKINGSYSNVVGFPLHEFTEKLKFFLGYEGDLQGKWREEFVS